MGLSGSERRRRPSIAVVALDELSRSWAGPLRLVAATDAEKDR
jgi:hypothetical protein